MLAQIIDIDRCIHEPIVRHSTISMCLLSHNYGNTLLLNIDSLKGKMLIKVVAKVHYSIKLDTIICFSNIHDIITHDENANNAPPQNIFQSDASLD